MNIPRELREFQPENNGANGHGPVTPARPPHRGTRVLLWAAGADPDKLPTPLERYRAAALGMFVFLIATLAAGTFVLYASIVADGFSPWFLVPGAFWGLLVFWVDRSILIEPQYGKLDVVEERVDANRTAVATPWPPESAPPAKRTPPHRHRSRWTWLGRFAVYTSRVGLAIAVAYLISEAVVLLIFAPEIDNELLASGNREFDAAIAVLAEDQANELQPRIDQLAGEITRLDGDLARAAADVAEAQHNYDLEVSGQGGSGDRGDGPLTRAQLDLLNKAKDDYRAEQQRHAVEVDRRNVEIQALTTQQTGLRSDGSPERARLADEPRGEELWRETHDTAGWLDREEAFQRFLDQQQNPVVHAIPWVVRAILLLVDLVPFTIKMMSGATLYGRAVRDEGQRIRHAARRRHLAAMDRVDHHGEMADYADDLGLALQYENRRTYYHTRTDHLRRN